jgi:hypothetical protein
MGSHEAPRGGGSEAQSKNLRSLDRDIHEETVEEKSVKKIGKHKRFKTKADHKAHCADHFKRPEIEQRRIDSLKRRKKERDKDRNEERARFEERGGIVHPPTAYPPGTERKKFNKNGVRLSKEGLQAKRECGIEMQELRFWKGERFASLKRPAASLLPGRDFNTGRFINGEAELVRSEAEVDTLHFIRGQLLHDVTIDNAETTYIGNQSDDVSLTFGGNLVRCTRDLDASIAGEKIQIQVKGTSVRKKLYWMLHAEDCSDKYSDLRYKPKIHNAKRKAFQKTAKNWLNWMLRHECNYLFLDYVRPEIQEVRAIAYVSAVSAKAWNKKSTILKNSGQLSDLLITETERFRDYYTRVIVQVFPTEAKVIRRSVEIFRTLHHPDDHPKWTCTDVAIELRRCLWQAKDEYNYDDSGAACYRRWYFKLRFDDLKLPLNFQPTSVKMRSPR